MNRSDTYQKGTFGHDLEILDAIDDLTVLRSGESYIAVSPSYQGRVFTSSSRGLKGTSYGWFNRELVKSGGSDDKFAALGGESRIWLGPEVGEFAVFFDPGAKQIEENIKISPELNHVRFNTVRAEPDEIVSSGKLNIRNAFGTRFKIEVRRRLGLIDREQIQSDLGIELDPTVTVVAFDAESLLKNDGEEAWSRKSGLLAVWEIGCMLPTDQTRVLIPIHIKGETLPTKVENPNVKYITNYFTPLDSSRLYQKDAVAVYKADAKYMNKIGVQPEFCTGLLGSYSPELNLLTLVKYNFESGGTYVNSHWEQTDPYKGDVVNVFNGVVDPANEYDLPFYELETSSPTKEVVPGEYITHLQSTYHFEGSQETLNKIARKVLGIDLNQLTEE